MSQLLDALRRAGRPPGIATAAAGQGPYAEHVLASLGFERSRERWPIRPLLWIGGGSLVVVATLAMLQWLQPGGGPVQPVAPAPAETTRKPPGSPSPRPLEPSPPQQPSERLHVQAPPLRPPTAHSPEHTRPPSPADQFGLALERQRSGDFERAMAAYQSLLARKEMVPKAQNNIGLLLQGRGRLDEAARAFQQSIAADPAYAKAHNNLGVLLLQQGQIEAAAERFRRAGELEPRDRDALVNLALADKAAGRLETAKESLLRMLLVDPRHAPAHYNLAVIYDQSGETGRAAEHYQAFLDNAGAEYTARAADVRARLEVLEKLRH